jgi:hypothetical protein
MGKCGCNKIQNITNPTSSFTVMPNKMHATQHIYIIRIHSKNKIKCTTHHNQLKTLQIQNLKEQKITTHHNQLKTLQLQNIK